jgi:hypothetical protein
LSRVARAERDDHDGNEARRLDLSGFRACAPEFVVRSWSPVQPQLHW